MAHIEITMHELSVTEIIIFRVMVYSDDRRVCGHIHDIITHSPTVSLQRSFVRRMRRADDSADGSA